MKFRKKPVVIEAVQMTRSNVNQVAEFLNGDRDNTFGYSDGRWQILTLEGVMTASPGDWIIKGVAGEFYPCKPDIFSQTYEPVEDE